MPDIVFHIGYHKTASTWLQQCYFAKHADIHLISNSSAPWNDPFLSYLITTSDRKFNAKEARDLLESQVREADAKSHRRVCLVSAERLSGHPASGGFDNVRIAERIKSCAPDAKIICIVRKQTDMILSVYRQLLREGYLGTLESFISNESWKTVGFGLEFYEYDLLVSKYSQLFGSQNMLALPYEQMKGDLKIFLAALTRFLGVEDIVSEKSSNIVNASLANRGLGMVRFYNHFLYTEFNQAPLFRLPRKGRGAIIRLATLLPNKKNILGQELRNSLIEYYCESNRDLQRYVPVDLGDLWGECV